MPRMKTCGFRCVNRVNSGPPNHHQGMCANGSHWLRKWNKTLEISRVLDWSWPTHGLNWRSDEDHTDDFHGIMGPWAEIIAQSWPSIGLQQIRRSAIIARFFYEIVFSLPLYLNSWLIVKQLSIFWRHILSSLWSPCILDSIPIRLRQDWSRIVVILDLFLHLNVERTPKRKRSNSLQSTQFGA